jgi:hypothetical protein
MYAIVQLPIIRKILAIMDEIANVGSPAGSARYYIHPQLGTGSHHYTFNHNLKMHF